MKNKTQPASEKSSELAVYSRSDVLRKRPTKNAKSSRKSRKRSPTPEQIHEFISEWLDVLPEQEARMMYGVLALSETCARQIMTPLSELLAVPVSTRVAQMKAMMRELDYSFIPVYEERIDRLSGIVSMMDILYADDDAIDLGTLIRSAYYIPETKGITELLDELRRSSEPIALVIDEHGSCVGAVTLEDILETIVGDIGPEEDPTHVIEATGPNSWVVDARASIQLVNQVTGMQIPKDRYDTVGGFVLKQFGKIPEPGEKFECQGRELLVSEVFDFGISEVQISQRQTSETTQRKR